MAIFTPKRVTSKLSETFMLAFAFAFACAAIALPHPSSAQSSDPFRDLIIAIGDAELGEYLSGECVTCHKSDVEPEGGVPQISGLPVEQFAVLLLSYRNKDRENPVMQTIAGRLSDEDIASLAAFFATREKSE